MLGNGRGGVSISNDGKIGQCYRCDGSNGKKIEVTLPSAITSSVGSLAIWIKWAAFPTSGSWANIIKVSTTTDGFVYSMLNICTQYQNQIAICNKGSSPYQTGHAYTHSFSLNTWYHLAETCDGTISKLYVNGVEVFSTNDVGSLASAQTIQIGGSGQGGSPLNGWINDARYYNHALTAEEVRSIVANGLMIHYPLNGMPGDSGNIEYDISGYHNDAEIVGVGKQGLVSSLAAPRYSQSYTNFNSANYIKKSDVAYDGGVWTISCWARSSAQPSAYESVFCLAKTDGEDANKKACICYSPTANTLWYELENKSGNIAGISYAAWHHFVMTCDGSTGKVYIDNELKVTVTGVTVRTECHNLGLGCRNENDAFTTGVRPFTTGNLFDFRFYTKCLTADEVTELYNMGKVN